MYGFPNQTVELTGTKTIRQTMIKKPFESGVECTDRGIVLHSAPRELTKTEVSFPIVFWFYYSEAGNKMSKFVQA